MKAHAFPLGTIEWSALLPDSVSTALYPGERHVTPANPMVDLDDRGSW
jgi:hypothetical protein